MQSTDLGNKESGKIWHRKPSPATHDGIIVNIVHSTSEYHPKVLRFLNVAFDGSGDSFIAGDHQGNIYVFDLHGNRFNLVQRTAQACTALAFNLRRKSEFLVALADYSIKCFDTVTKELVSWMRGHESSVCSISVHASGRYAITTSSDTAQLWDLDTFQRKRKLNIRQSVGIQKVFFLPFSSLVDKGTHAAYLSLQKKYPIKSRKLLRVLQRTLSALAHWSAIFSDTPYLPLLAFPFVKLFQNNQLICFEVVATLIINWCQHWFEYFPNPPINILSMIENVLAFHDKELLQHFIDRDITSQVYAWPLLETLFSEVLTREEWLRLFDNIFSNHPSFLLMTVVAYSTCSRAPLLNCTLKNDFEYFFHHRNNLDINVVIREVYHLMETTPADIHPNSMLDAFVALTKGQYPIFNQYPKFIVDYQTREWERIRNDELDFLRERQTVENMQAEVDEQRAKDEIERKVQMRDQEIAATAKDLEIRQLELEAQKRLYEKDLTTSQEAVAKEIREDTDAHRRKAALEEHMFQKLLENSQMGGRRAQRWKEAEEKEFHLQSAKKASALSDASRKWFLRQETSAALEHEEMPWLQRQYMDSAYLPQTSRLHDVSDMDPSTHIFSRNYPTEWNHMEHDLLKNVRDLRRRLTARARNSCRHPHLLVT